MSRPRHARPRAARARRALELGAVLLLGLAALLVSGHSLRGNFALPFSGETAYSSSSFATASLSPPTALTAIPSGDGVSLSWSTGANGDGQSVDAAALTSTAASCSAADTFSTLSSTLTTAATSYTTSTAAGETPGDAYCYAVSTTYGTTWSASAYASAIAGFATTGLALGAGTTPGQLGGASITLTFNQPLTLPTNPVTKMCVIEGGTNGGTLLIGDTTVGSGTCASSDTAAIGRLTLSGGSLGTAGSSAQLTVSYHNSGSSLTVRFPASSITTSGGTWTFTPGASLTTTSSGSSVAACTTGTYCTPTAQNTGAF